MPVNLLFAVANDLFIALLFIIGHDGCHGSFVMRSGGPMTEQEYDAASPFRRWLERLYRGPFGPLVYYYGEFRLYRLVLPLSQEARAQWKRSDRFDARAGRTSKGYRPPGVCQSSARDTGLPTPTI
ncbi:MAG: hypothetical protein ACREHF_10270 [Rhizomicrobium sp.]